MRTIIISLLFICYSFPQGMYLPKVNGISASFLYGQYGYDTDNKLSLSATYSILGVFDISYSRSSIITEQDINNFQNEFSLRGYLLKENRFFISGAIGYQYQEIEYKIWNDFPLSFTSKGISYELGLHLASTDQEDKKIVLSIFYKHYAPIEEMQKPTVNVRSSDLARSFTFDLALIYYLGQVGLEIGPRLVLDNDFNYPFIGLNLNLIVMH